MDQRTHFLITAGFWVSIVYSFSPLYDLSLTRKVGLFYIISFVWLYLATNIPDSDLPYSKIIPRLSLLDNYLRKKVVNPVLNMSDNDEHRGITHSLNGMFHVTRKVLIFLLIGTLCCLVLQILIYWRSSTIFLWNLFLRGQWEAFQFLFQNFFEFFVKGLIVSLVSFTFGYLSHLWVDSTTLKGTRWFYPNGKIMKGFIRTGTQNEIRAIRFFFIIILLIIYLEMLLIRTETVDFLRLIFFPLSILAFLIIGYLLRSPWFAFHILKHEVCPECNTTSILKKGTYGVYWECPACGKKFDASKDLDYKPTPLSYLSQSPIFIFLDFLFAITTFLGLTLRIDILILLAIGINGSNLILAKKLKDS